MSQRRSGGVVGKSRFTAGVATRNFSGARYGPHTLPPFLATGSQTVRKPGPSAPSTRGAFGGLVESGSVTPPIGPPSYGPSSAHASKRYFRCTGVAPGGRG